MTAPGRYAASDGSFAKSAGGAAARGGVLIAIAVLIGVVLLWKGFDGADTDTDVASGGDAATSDDGDSGGDDPVTTDTTDDGDTDTTEPTDGDDGDDGDTDTTEPTDTTTPVVVDDPADVTVAVLNGTGEAGLAGSRGEALGAVGYTWTAGNAAGVPVQGSRVYYTDGFADEAKAVAEALSGGAGVLEQAPADPTTLATASGAEDVTAADIVVVLGADGALS